MALVAGASPYYKLDNMMNSSELQPKMLLLLSKPNVEEHYPNDFQFVKYFVSAVRKFSIDY